MNASRFAALIERARTLIRENSADPWIALLGESRWIGAGTDTWHLTEKVDGYAPDRSSRSFSGPAGNHGPAANTAVDFAGRSWAMVQLPLPATDTSALRLLLHESWHAFGQPIALAGLNLDERGGDDLLDGAPGRTWLRLQLVALSAAVGADSAAERRRHAACALAFHNRIRDLATAEEMRRQHNLEISEGIAEFIGWKGTDPARSRVSAHVASLPATGTAIRSFPYRTGVGWGFLLDEFHPSWRDDVHSEPDLPALLARSIEPADADRFADDYGHERIAREESLRAVENQRVVAELRRRFMEEPVLRLPGPAGGFTFDPHRLTPLPGGTVYAPAKWSDADGVRLTAADGVFVAADWSELRIALDGVQIEPGAGLQVTGEGWSLTLPENWRIERDGRDWTARSTG